MKLSMTKINRNVLLSFEIHLMFFWGLWLLIVAFTDTIDYLQTLSLITKNFPFSSKNFNFLTNFVSKYFSNPFFVHSIYIFIISWVYLLIGVWWRQFKYYMKDRRVVHLSKFCKNLTLLTAFFVLADEFFIQYEIEHGHLLRFAAQICTIIYFSFLERDEKNMKRK